MPTKLPISEFSFLKYSKLTGGSKGLLLGLSRQHAQCPLLQQSQVVPIHFLGQSLR